MVKHPPRAIHSDGHECHRETEGVTCPEHGGHGRPRRFEPIDFGGGEPSRTRGRKWRTERVGSNSGTGYRRTLRLHSSLDVHSGDDRERLAPVKACRIEPPDTVVAEYFIRDTLTERRSTHEPMTVEPGRDEQSRSDLPNQWITVRCRSASCERWRDRSSRPSRDVPERRRGTRCVARR